MSKTVLFKRSKEADSDGNAVLPSSSDLDYGEIALNYAAGVECISIKNSDNEVVTLNFSESDESTEHINDTSNPHEVNSSQIGLGNCDNTSDTDKEVNEYFQAELDTKLDIAKIWNYTSLTDGTNTYTEEELAEWAFSAAAGYTLSASLNAYINMDTSEIESRIEALEGVLIAD